jgi:hypothetical protein
MEFSCSECFTPECNGVHIYHEDDTVLAKWHNKEDKMESKDAKLQSLTIQFSFSLNLLLCFLRRRAGW